MLILALLSTFAIAKDTITYMELGVEGMDCDSCEAQLEAELIDLSPVKSAFASAKTHSVCLTLFETMSQQSLTDNLAHMEQYTVTNIKPTTTCPSAEQVKRKRNPWFGQKDVDASIISHGEKVDFNYHLVADKFTLFDFGAPWCGPCRIAATTFKAYMANHPDLAVRAIHLDARDAASSFALPAAKQHLTYVAGLPYFVLYDPKGKVRYRGQEADQLLLAVEKARKK